MAFGAHGGPVIEKISAVVEQLAVDDVMRVDARLAAIDTAIAVALENAVSELVSGQKDPSLGHRTHSVH
jgi:hypothetical protein